PIGAIAALPFARLPWPLAKLGWLALNHAAVWGALALLWSLAGWPPWWPVATALLLGTCRPLQVSFYYGQGDGLILLWLAIGAWALTRAEPGEGGRAKGEGRRGKGEEGRAKGEAERPE